MSSGSYFRLAKQQLDHLTIKKSMFRVLWKCRLLRHSSTTLGLGFENLPPLHQANAISTSIREASQAVDSTRQEKRTTLQSKVGTKEYDKSVRNQCKPIKYSQQLLKHLAILCKLGINDSNILINLQHYTTVDYTLHIQPAKVSMARLPTGEKTGTNLPPTPAQLFNPLEPPSFYRPTWNTEHCPNTQRSSIPSYTPHGFHALNPITFQQTQYAPMTP
jgi:hypothetical protein